MDNPGKSTISGGMKERLDIVIAGGGLNGTTLALALAQSGFRVALVDPIAATDRGEPGFDGRGYALALSSQRMLKALGLWPAVADHAQPMLEIKVSDGRPGEGPAPHFLEFHHAEIEESPMGYMLEDRFLRPALLAACADHPFVESYNGDSVAALVVNGSTVSVHLASGQTLAAGLVIGCDGRNSPVSKMAGIGRSQWSYGQTALVCAVAHALPHNGVAHQYFMPHGPLAILPLPGNQSSIVWSESDEDAARISALDDAAFLEELRPRFGDFLGEISLAGQRFSYPLGVSLAENFVADRVALVGDAAHGMHPIAGQGLNAGLKDVAALTEVLTLARRRGEDIAAPDVLARYQRWRRFDVATLIAATDGFNRLFSNDNPLLRAGRDLGLSLVNAIPGLRRNFIREAAGLTGELPLLLQGRAI